MNFYETKTQFRILEEGEVAPSGAIVYSLKATSDVYDSYTVELPEFEIEIQSYANWGYRSVQQILYKGVRFRPKIKGNWELGVLNILNQLKASSDWRKLIVEIIKESMSEDDYKIVSSVIEAKNLRAEYLEKKIKDLEKTMVELKLSEGLKEENERLKYKIEQIKTVLKND